MRSSVSDVSKCQIFNSAGLSTLQNIWCFWFQGRPWKRHFVEVYMLDLNSCHPASIVKAVSAGFHCICFLSVFFYVFLHEKVSARIFIRPHTLKVDSYLILIKILFKNFVCK